MVVSILENVFHEMVHFSKIRQVNNWQGNSDFKGSMMRVLHEVSLRFNCPLNIDKAQDITLCDLPWSEDHFQERIGGKPTNPGNTYKYWPYHIDLDNSNYKEEKFSHTYQERFWPKRADTAPHVGFPLVGIRYELGDLNDLIEQLGNDPATRQAYLPIWFPEDTGAQNRRVPCSLGYYFYIDNGFINCIYNIRSCDIYRHFRNDVYFTIRLLQYIQETINNKYNLQLKLGTIKMDIYNLHLFVNDSYALIKKEQKLHNQVFNGITTKDLWVQRKE